MSKIKCMWSRLENILIKFFDPVKTPAHIRSSDKGYACTRILIEILLKGLKGLKMYTAGVALKRNIVFPRFNTIKV